MYEYLVVVVWCGTVAALSICGDERTQKFVDNSMGMYILIKCTTESTVKYGVR